MAIKIGPKELALRAMREQRKPERKLKHRAPDVTHKKKDKPKMEKPNV